MGEPLWRVFPWDPAAEDGAPVSATYLPDQSGQGRFDLPRTVAASSWYFAQSPEHAVAEKLQDLRNQPLLDDFLFERGRRLAIGEWHTVVLFSHRLPEDPFVFSVPEALGLTSPTVRAAASALAIELTG